MKLVIVTVSTDADLDPAFANFASQHVGAILPDAEPFLGNSWRRLVVLAERHKVPMMQEWREAVAGGGLISYAPSFRWIMQQVGRYTGQILNSAKVADLPVIAPTKIELTLNLKTAKALGLTVPPLLLARADEVIEYAVRMLPRVGCCLRGSLLGVTTLGARPAALEAPARSAGQSETRRSARQRQPLNLPLFRLWPGE